MLHRWYQVASAGRGSEPIAADHMRCQPGWPSAPCGSRRGLFSPDSMGADGMRLRKSRLMVPIRRAVTFLEACGCIDASGD
ncbi:hypothetical protein [Xanthomonas arboricola]|uniref:hypothetical protein n=1 Tax=Xanthomonas arboricola TaxID=56448 RepID=UPI0012907EFA|nr:hypothetical protein [Xanthomonas arboricola]